MVFMKHPENNKTSLVISLKKGTLGTRGGVSRRAVEIFLRGVLYRICVHGLECYGQADEITQIDISGG